MILVKDRERCIRILEAMNALSVVLPIYDPELRGAFRASFKIDLYLLLPKFFKDLTRLEIEHEDEFMGYLTYIEQLINYVRDAKAGLPIPADAREAAFTDCRKEAEMFMKSWNVKEK